MIFRFRSAQELARATVCGGLTAIAMMACGPAQAEAVEAPLRVVRVGQPDLPGLRQFIDMSYEGCLAAKGRPPAPAPALPDSALAKLLVHEEEELFDGSKWAKYEVHRAVGADQANGCKLVVFHARSVQIENTCESSIDGMTATLSELMDPQGQGIPKPELRESKGTQPECGQPRHAIDVKGLRAEDAGQGAQCIWNAELEARAAGAKNGGSPSFDICLYSKRPFYYVKGYGRAVVLKARSSDRSLTGAYIPAMAGQLAGYGNAKLVSLSDGQSIAADRFSRASAEAFLRQPVKTPIGSE